MIHHRIKVISQNNFVESAFVPLSKEKRDPNNACKIPPEAYQGAASDRLSVDVRNSSGIDISLLLCYKNGTKRLS